ncbi:hypothetical protein HY004_02465 [Candidatus Saccharibacteria bacterium]|nr:hypothetical protein [Candidatus Saccharibacteria bacterium]
MKINKIKNYILIAFTLLGLVSVFVPASQVSAAQAIPQCDKDTNAAICQTKTGLISGILKSVINTMIFLAGSIAVIMIVVGGIRYITSDGDPGAATKAKNTIIYALVGVVVAIMSYSIVNFVIDRI